MTNEPSERGVADWRLVIYRPPVDWRPADDPPIVPRPGELLQSGMLAIVFSESSPGRWSWYEGGGVGARRTAETEG